MVVCGVDIRIFDVDIIILGVDIVVCRVDIRTLDVDITVLGVDIAVMRPGERGASHVRRLEASCSARVSRCTRSHKGRGAPCCKPILGVRSGRGLGC